MLCVCLIQMAMADLEKRSLKNIISENTFRPKQRVEIIMTTEMSAVAWTMKDARAIRLKTSYSFRF